MKNDKTKIDIKSTTLKNTMNRIQTEQETVFALAASQSLRRPYGHYGKNRKKPKSLSHNISTSTQLSASQAQGQKHEQQAIALLQSKGMILIAKNLRCKMGEIDCVMLHQNTLVFVEVRQRSHDHFGDAATSINQQKQRKIKQSAAYFLPQLCRQLRLTEAPHCRFDVITFDGKEKSFQWLVNAFD